ncbi:hypothetical protein KQX54_003140 [Cotesia glomerata]|uniref:Uncharacterized protein n=1 Tax=Cotesia glomerata TaxID=32391 RepID=A0AAV7IID5_COTGL|nr:hypothetical protein KQX54_003140 [Cotesia glomerata]
MYTSSPSTELPRSDSVGPQSRVEFDQDLDLILGNNLVVVVVEFIYSFSQLSVVSIPLSTEDAKIFCPSEHNNNQQL